jgi:hypothetical protein
MSSKPTVKHTPLNQLPKTEKFWGNGADDEIALLKEILEQLKILNNKLSPDENMNTETNTNRWSKKTYD